MPAQPDIQTRLEDARLAALASYDVLDTPREADFDEVAELASAICGTPIAVVNLIADGRQFFKAEVGLGVRETPLESSFCARAILEQDFMLVPDATRDPRFDCNPLVAGEPHLRFYAGALLKTEDGHAIGTVCVLDYMPRDLTELQMRSLRMLARQVMKQLELRRALRERRADERRHRRVLESAVDYAIISLDLGGRVTGWNRGAELIMGWPEGEILGAPIDTIFTDEDRAAGVPAAEMQAARDQGRGNDERWHLRRDGSHFFAQGEMMPLEDETGLQIGYLKILRDRSEQRAAADRLGESEARYRRLFQAIDAGFCIVEMVYDAAGRPVDYVFVEVNPAFERQAGFTPRAGQSMREIAPEHEQHWFEAYGEVARTGEPAFLENGSAQLGRWWEVHAFRAGDPAQHRVGVLFTDVSRRRQMEQALLDNEVRLREFNAELGRLVNERTRERDTLWETTNDLMGVAGFDGYMKSVNPAWTQMLGWSEEVILGRPFAEIIEPADHAETAEMVRRLAAGERVSGFVDRLIAQDGKRHVVMWTAVPDVAAGRFNIIGRDITEQRQAEEALRQSQKMEAVGQLTGGLAHDFNNLLAGISGSLELMGTRIRQGRIGELDRYLDAATGASRRAAALTHRLLAFSRRQTLDPRPVDVNRLVVDMEDLVRRTVGPSIDLEVVGAAGLWTALVDANQLENALLNLCINARDAMPNGGRITIETANRRLDSRAARERDLAPGPYLSLCVTDTGTGMTPEVAARAFDPFFTTKPMGEGTGLGLSMIYGFARQSGGQVRIYSELGQGTTMCIYLPRHHGAAGEPEIRPAQERSPTAGHGRVVLVIDDEPTVRMLVAEVVGGLGHDAVEAEDGPSGLALLRSDRRIDLLITDVGLPGGMNGRQIADAARVGRPGLQVLFITGYAENAVIGNGHLEPGMQVITKPFAMDDLAARVEAMLDREDRPGATGGAAGED